MTQVHTVFIKLRLWLESVGFERGRPWKKLKPRFYSSTSYTKYVNKRKIDVKHLKPVHRSFSTIISLGTDQNLWGSRTGTIDRGEEFSFYYKNQFFIAKKAILEGQKVVYVGSSDSSVSLAYDTYNKHR